jgi:tetratricopeptide (TPR) repeat protein
MLRMSGLAVSLVLVFAMPVAAQSNEVAEARALFQAGEAAVEAGRWADAVDSFRRAYELSNVPAALFNLGYALRALGRHREARDAFAELLREHPRFDRELREEARRYEAEAEARIAMVQLQGLAADIRHVLRFDGRPIADDGARPISLEADPGAHTLTVRLEGRTPFVWEGDLGPGQRLAIDVELPMLTSASGERWTGGEPEAPVDEDDGSVIESPWFWILLSVGLLGAGAGITGYLLWDAAQIDPESNRVYTL